MCIVFTQCKTGEEFIKSLSLKIDSFFQEKQTKKYVYSTLFRIFLKIHQMYRTCYLRNIFYLWTVDVVF